MAPGRGLALGYFALALVGMILPYAAFLPWVDAHGIDPRCFVRELVSTRIGSFFGLDVVMSAIVLLVFVVAEGGGMRRRWVPVAATFLVGVSCGLPLFLGMRRWSRS